MAVQINYTAADHVNLLANIDLCKALGIPSSAKYQQVVDHWAAIDDIRIDNANITNLSGLEHLVGMSGNFHLHGNKLVKIDELSNMTIIGGDLTLHDNASLENLSGLSSLLSVDGDIVLRGNPSLTNLDGLSGLKVIYKNLLLGNNENLTDISALNNITEVKGDLKLDRNNKLRNVDGLISLGDIGGDFYLNDNQELRDISGLATLTSVGGSFYLNRNQNMTNLDGLSALTIVGNSFSLNDNTQLSDLSGLNTKLKVAGNVSTRRINLTTIAGMGYFPELAFNAESTGFDALNDYGQEFMSSIYKVEYPIGRLFIPYSTFTASTTQALIEGIILNIMNNMIPIGDVSSTYSQEELNDLALAYENSSRQLKTSIGASIGIS